MKRKDIAKLLLPGTVCYRVLLVLKEFETTAEIAQFLGVGRQRVHSALRELEDRGIHTDLIRRIRKKNKKRSGRNLKKEKEMDFFTVMGDTPRNFKKKKKPGKTEKFLLKILNIWSRIERLTQEEIDRRRDDWVRLYHILFSEDLEDVKAAVERYVAVLENPDRYTVATKVDIMEYFTGSSLLSYEKMKRWDEFAHEYYRPLDEDSIVELRDAVEGSVDNIKQLEIWAKMFGPIVWRLRDGITR